MNDKPWNGKLAVTLIALAGLVAAPLAWALPVGVGAGGFGDVTGAKPAYGQIWVGEWTDGRWSSFESDLRAVRDAGATPVILWYYWGDSISVNAVKYGTGGKSRGEWDAMAGEIGRRANAIMGGKEFLVVMEPEFNKNGIQSWDTFDGYLASQAWGIRGAAPGARVVMGFGHWGGWDGFDRAMDAAHYSGFQWLRGSTRDSAASAEQSADRALEITKALRSRWGKDVVLYDVGISTYGGWDGVQERALARFVALERELEAAGLKGFVWRTVRDNNYSSGYYGAAEATWGVMRASGEKKPGYDELVSFIGTEAAAPVPSTGSSAPSTGAFSGVKGNEWWIQANVAGGPSSVSAQVNGGAPVAMPRQSWGAYAVSTRAPTGSSVELTATYAGGATVSASYRWPDATPTTATPSAPVASGGDTLEATFTPSGNAWWVQTKVTAPESVTRVEARVNGGGWTPLTKQWWGEWATSMRAPAGTLELRATGASGATDVDSMAWRG